MIMQTALKNQVVVRFRLPASIWADTIYLVGDFNNWDTRATPMRLDEQYWEASFIMPAGGVYAYAYLIDGKEWCSECHEAVRDSAAQAQPICFLPLEIQEARARAARHN